MALMSIRSTYALDPETAEAIRRLAGRWHTSQADVIRRAVRSLAERADREPEMMRPIDVIAHYRRSEPPRSTAGTKELIGQMHSERRAEEEARQGRLSPRSTKP
ncbi:MAG: ribbon-helix-helix protein, CopG family [Burkholderiales bacterium]